MSERKDKWAFRIEDILHSIDRIEKTVRGVAYEQYAEDQDKIDIVDRRLQIIGEAARKLPDHVKKKYRRFPGV